MTKKNRGAAYHAVASALVKKVRGVVADAGRHHYSVSRVYEAHNEVFGLKENPQTCGTCLRNRARSLREWLAGYDEYVKNRPIKGRKPSGRPKDSSVEEKSENGAKKGQGDEATESPESRVEDLT